MQTAKVAPLPALLSVSLLVLVLVLCSRGSCDVHVRPTADVNDSLPLVCDAKGADDMKAFRLNEDKLLRWLKAKVVGTGASIVWGGRDKHVDDRTHMARMSTRLCVNVSIQHTYTHTLSLCHVVGTTLAQTILMARSLPDDLAVSEAVSANFVSSSASSTATPS